MDEKPLIFLFPCLILNHIVTQKEIQKFPKIHSCHQKKIESNSKSKLSIFNLEKRNRHRKNVPRLTFQIKINSNYSPSSIGFSRFEL